MPRYGDAYWDRERPTEAEAGSTLIRYFRQAGKVQFHRTFTASSGERRTAAVVTIDVEALALSAQAVQLLRQALDDAADLAVAGSGAAGGERLGPQ